MSVRRWKTLLRPAGLGLNTKLSPYLLPTERASELAGLCTFQSGGLAHSKGREGIATLDSSETIYGIAPIDVRLAAGQSQVGVLVKAGTHLKLLYKGLVSNYSSGFTSVGGELRATNLPDQAFVTDGIDDVKVIYYDSGWTVRDAGIEGPSGAPTVTVYDSGGQLGEGSYLVCYRYYNSKSGHRSKPSPITKATVSTSGNTHKLTVRVEKSSQTGVDKIEIFRTTANGSILWLDKTVSNADGDYDIGVDTNDLSIGIGRYWEEWIHDSDWHSEPPPKCKYIKYYQGVVFCGGRVGTTNLGDAEIAFSIPDFPYAFPAENRWCAGAAEKTLTGFAVVGDALYAFFTSSIVKIQRVGNQLTFIGNVFGNSIGCMWPNSLIDTGDFAAFFGRDSVYLLTPAGISDIGTEIADIIQSLDSDSAPVACGYEPLYKELWWYFSGDWALVYSLPEKVWRKELLRRGDYACTAPQKAETSGGSGAVLYVVAGRQLFAESRGIYNGAPSSGYTVYGTVTSTGKQVVDSSATFKTSGMGYKGLLVYILSGDNAGISRLITDNTSTSLTTSDFPNSFAVGDKYAIAPVPSG